MAKKHLGSLIALAAVAGAAAAGVSYFLKYKSFHKELEEDFHDFEDDGDEFEYEDEEEEDKEQVKRTYVPINSDKSDPEKACEDTAKTDSGRTAPVSEAAGETNTGENTKEADAGNPATTIVEDTAE